MPLPDKFRQLFVQNKRIKVLEDWVPTTLAELNEVKEMAEGIKAKLTQLNKSIKSAEKPKTTTE